LFSKPILIQKDQIEVMKKNIILNVDYKERQKSIFSKKRRK